MSQSDSELPEEWLLSSEEGELSVGRLIARLWGVLEGGVLLGRSRQINRKDGSRREKYRFKDI